MKTSIITNVENEDRSYRELGEIITIILSKVMTNTLKIHELTIAVAINNYDLTLCLPRFLQSSGIVPKEWTLGSEPVANNQLIQTVYSNGVNIIGQPTRCLFAENLEEKEPTSSEAPKIVSNYISALPNLEYQAVGINLRGYISLGKGGEATSKEFFDKLLVSGSWQNKGTKPMEAELKLNYIFDDKVLTLNVNSGMLNKPEKEPIPIILFSGNFAYSMVQDALDSRAERVKIIASNYQEDIRLFQDVISGFPKITTKSKQKATA